VPSSYLVFQCAFALHWTDPRLTIKVSSFFMALVPLFFQLIPLLRVDSFTAIITLIHKTFPYPPLSVYFAPNPVCQPPFRTSRWITRSIGAALRPRSLSTLFWPSPIACGKLRPLFSNAISRSVHSLFLLCFWLESLGLNL